MRIGIVYLGSTSPKLESISKVLSENISSSASHIVDLINIDIDGEKQLTGYNRIFFLCGKESLFSNKIPAKFVNYIRGCGHLSGKKVYAVTVKGFMAQKFLLNLMNFLENQAGVIIKNSFILSSANEGKMILNKIKL